jgi:FkbM family methyltransferase
MIPRLIHQTWRDREPPADMARLERTWRDLNPAWHHQLWTDADGRQLIERCAPWFLPVYDAYPEPIMRVDAFRYFLMFHVGGVYVDLDFECLRPIDELVRGGAALVALEPDEHLAEPVVGASGLPRVVANAFLASVPGHPFWPHVFAWLQKARGQRGPLEATGPFLLTRALESWGGTPVSIIPTRTVFPLPKRRLWSGALAGPGARERLRREGAFAVHHWMGTWVRTHGAFLPLEPAMTALAPAAPATAGAAAPPDPPARTGGARPSVLILVPVKNAVRHLDRFVEALQALDWPRDRLSLGFLESDSGDGTYERLAALRPALERTFRRVSLWKRDFGFHPRAPRWHTAIQRERRSILARSRNELLARTLAPDDDWVLWLDVDVAGWPADLIQRLLAAGKDVVVPHVVSADRGDTFDLNTWRAHPAGRGLDFSPWMIDGLLQPPRGLGRQYLGDLQDQSLVEVDAVGGCTLLVRADLHRAGVLFPEEPVEGLIETEGLAVLARRHGSACFGLPRLRVVHATAGDPGWQGQIVKLGDGRPIEVDARDLVGGSIARHGYWEVETVAFVEHWLRPGMTVVDAGAHVGQYAMVASRRVGPGGRVHAFEPHPDLYRVLRRNLERAGCTNAVAQPLALGGVPEERSFFLHPVDNLGASSLRASAPDRDQPAVRVQVTTLDAYLAAHDVTRVDLLKVDVEGAERDLLAGAGRTLAANPDIVLVIEFLRANARRFGHTLEELAADLRAQGFRLFTLSAHGLAPYAPVGELPVNVVAARQVMRLLSGMPEPLAARLLMRLRDAARGPRAPERGPRG